MNNIYRVTLAFKATSVTFEYYVMAESRREAIDKCSAPWDEGTVAKIHRKNCKAVIVSFVTPVRI